MRDVLVPVVWSLPFWLLALFLVRHATAGVRNNLNPSDDQRPLDAFGLDQAQALAALLSQRQITDVFTSPALRCVQTITPLATRLGLELQLATELFEGASRSVSMEFVRSLTGRSAVLCSHGDVIPDVLRSLEIGGTRLEGRGCAKGSIWELDNSTERIESGSYLGPVAMLAEAD